MRGSGERPRRAGPRTAASCQWGRGQRLLGTGIGEIATTAYAMPPLIDIVCPVM